ncbi:DUF6611 family protein [Mycobacterium sp. WMMD1722]|uniref:DUF6611 family protein n=1 Tax=Mycobacterium sp. WMMD1722 TaxID=3404117 RepID=UPI003BF5E7A0
MRLLDGSCEWGGLDIRTDRAGFTRYRLVVYPPGIGASERRWLRVYRGWPVWGSALWAVTAIAAHTALGVPQALGVATAVALAGRVVSAYGAGGHRHAVRVWSAVLLAGVPEESAIGARDRIKRLALPLCHADEAAAAGTITPAQHEWIWWQVYDAMSPRPASFAAGRAAE